MALDLNNTEFGDALRQHGILPKLPTPPRSPSPTYRPITAKDPSSGSEGEGSDLDSELDDDIPPDVLAAYTRSRMSQLSRPRYGSVVPISKADYSREVTEGSKTRPGSDVSVPVICFLWDDAVDESRLLSGYLSRLARTYPFTKFVSIVGNMCIENYPLKNIPTLIIYRNGDVVRQTVGLSSSQAPGFSKENTTFEAVESLLLSCGAVEAELKQT